jgi:hypothetical protein
LFDLHGNDVDTLRKIESISENSNFCSISTAMMSIHSGRCSPALFPNSIEAFKVVSCGELVVDEGRSFRVRKKLSPVGFPDPTNESMSSTRSYPINLSIRAIPPR